MIEMIINILQFTISSIFIYGTIKYLLPEAKKGIINKKCTSWSRTLNPKQVKGKEAIYTGLFYIFLSILFIIAFILSLKVGDTK